MVLLPIYISLIGLKGFMLKIKKIERITHSYKVYVSMVLIKTTT